MLSNKFILSFILLFVGLATAHASRVDELNQVFANYNKRFATGAYVKNPALATEFTTVQENFAAKLKTSQALKPILVIRNDYDSSLVVTLFVLVNEAGNLLALYHEKSTYGSVEERSFLRFRLPAAFEKGVGFIAIDGGYALNVKGFYFKPDTSATIQFNYITDLRNKTTGTINLFLLKKNNTWDFYTEKHQLVRSADVQTWSSFFPPNGGVKAISLK
jgi:hypothetical protein